MVFITRSGDFLDFISFPFPVHARHWRYVTFASLDPIIGLPTNVCYEGIRQSNQSKISVHNFKSTAAQCEINHLRCTFPYAIA
uniref:Uncharacterized protein n=1 Tax=Pararge aegeria TaxID=116150 RepID=S4P1J8_9NEOP